MLPPPPPEGNLIEHKFSQVLTSPHQGIDLICTLFSPQVFALCESSKLWDCTSSKSKKKYNIELFDLSKQLHSSEFSKCLKIRK